ncbi:HAD family phosphatase [Fulvivirgaceae bacterium BMA12]|uniref:HAD family phosphatase n=1 Tax=Agaribacillus aureus TaxID=3051825 RepID=A0ABT8L677_9BACT|nr:HAD family phosphatase [Fulvivirgaceae bacterium BMA12]
MKDFAVIFDMDGVLIDSNPYHKKALIQFCQSHGYNLTEEELKARIYGRTNKDWITNLFNGEVTGEELKRYADEKEALFRQLYEGFVEPVTGLETFLQMLESQDITRAIATSAPRANVDFTLQQTGMGKFFTTILDDSNVEHGKPDPEIYLKTASAIHYDPENCVVIEDSLSGVMSAKQAGAKVIGITTTHSKDELSSTDLVIDDFTALNIEVIESIF